MRQHAERDVEGEPEPEQGEADHEDPVTGDIPDALGERAGLEDEGEHRQEREGEEPIGE